MTMVFHIIHFDLFNIGGTYMKLGIMAAMPDEVHTIHNDLDFYREEGHGERSYYFSKQENIDLFLVYSRVGKVSASSTATTLIEKYGVDYIVFTGVAGAVDQSLNIGDIVLGKNTYQHDMDARPLFPRFEVPLTGSSLFEANKQEINLASQAIQNFISNIKNYLVADFLNQFNIETPKLYVGTIATGDQFIKDPLHHDGLKINGENVLAVEMEGAAVAQVCKEHNVPYIIIRTISDKADHSAVINFQSFITNIASHYSSGIVQEYLRCLIANDRK